MNKFYKNSNRFTCIFPDGYFIQILKLGILTRIAYGTSIHFAKDCAEYDVESDRETFVAELEAAAAGLEFGKSRLTI